MMPVGSLMQKSYSYRSKNSHSAMCLAASGPTALANRQLIVSSVMRHNVNAGQPPVGKLRSAFESCALLVISDKWCLQTQSYCGIGLYKSLSEVLNLSSFYSSPSGCPSMLWRCCLGGRKAIRPVKTEWWDTSMVICLGRGADLYMAQLMPLPLTISWLALPFWYWLTQVVPDKIQRAVNRS